MEFAPRMMKQRWLSWNRVASMGGLLMVLLGVACQQSNNTQTPAQPKGVYRLVTVDGKSLPATLQHDGAKLEIRSGALTFATNGTCTSKMVFVPPSGTETTREVAATFRTEGSKVSMQWTGAGVTFGTLNGKTFTMNNEGTVLAYEQ
jgi:hypothetical protein